MAAPSTANRVLTEARRGELPIVLQGAVPAPAAGRVMLFSEDGAALLMKKPDGSVVTVGPGGGGGSGGPTLPLTETAAGSVPTPANGQATVFTPDGVFLNMRDDSGINRVVGSLVYEQDLYADYVNTTPAAPIAGLRLFSRKRAWTMPAFIGPLGQDSALQAHFGTNKVRLLAVATGTAAPAGFGLTFVANVASTAMALAAPTNFYTAQEKVYYPTAATANSAGGFRTTNSMLHLSSVANAGGFKIACTGAVDTYQAGIRTFVGLQANTGAPGGGTDPSAVLNTIGFAKDAADTNWQFIRNDASGTATKVDTGFIATDAQEMYEWRIAAASGGGQSVRAAMVRLRDGAVWESAALTTDLPAVNTLLTFHLWMSNGATAVARQMAFKSLYVETDN